MRAPACRVESRRTFTRDSRDTPAAYDIQSAGLIPIDSILPCTAPAEDDSPPGFDLGSCFTQDGDRLLMQLDVEAPEESSWHTLRSLAQVAMRSYFWKCTISAKRRADQIQ